MANNQAFKIKNGLSAKRYLQNSTAVSASDVDLSTGSYFTKTLSANTTFTFSNPPASGKAMGFALEVTGANVTVGYDLANASYDSVSFSVASQETDLYSLVFNNDGTKLYIIGYASDNVHQYSLSTAYDISTASYDSVGFNVNSEDAYPVSLVFKPDGTKMYVLGLVSDSVHQYSLSTAYDVSTASYDSVSFSVASQDTNPYDIKFNNDGTKIYMVGGNDTVYQYTLSTAYDISTASYGSVSFSVASQDTRPYGLVFNNDGTKMFTAGDFNNTVYQYVLSTGFDLSTASYDNVSFSVASQTGVPYGIIFNNDGTKMYIASWNDDKIYQYSTAGTPAPATVAWPSSVKWSGATTPDAPAAGEKDVYLFLTTDGGTTYYAKQAGDAVA